ncbi:MAG: GrpB family protein [Acidimicrobiia bacterium]
MDADLRDRLLTVGLDPDRITDPAAAYRMLFSRFGQRATLLDRYQLEEHHRQIPIDNLTREERILLWLEVAALRYPEAEVIGSRTDAFEPIELVDYDPGWPAAFEEWRQALGVVLGDEARSIHHIGSTSVPGLPAKPVIDVLVCMGNVEDESTYVDQIESLRLPLRSREPGHRYFRPGKGVLRTVHIHVCQSGSDWERDHVGFRDLLRSDAEAAKAYAQLKRSLANTYRDDRLAYTEGKTGFVLDALEGR